MPKSKKKPTNKEQKQRDELRAKLGEGTVEELSELVKKRVSFQFAKERVKKAEKLLNEQILEIDVELTKRLEANELKKFVHPMGTISVQSKESVKIPQNQEDKKKLFEWLEEKGIFDEYASVNSMSINTLHKKFKERLLEDAKVSGCPDDLKKALNFGIPGLGTPTVYEIIKLTNKKERVD